MKDVILLVLGAILGAGVSLLVTISIQDRAKESLERARRVRKSKKIRRGISPECGSVSIVNRDTSFHLVEGDGNAFFAPDTVRVRLEEHVFSTPSALESKIAKRRIELAETSDTGPRPAWNGDSLVSLFSYSLARSGVHEQIDLQLSVVRSDYAAFSSTILELDDPLLGEDFAGRSLRDRYLRTAALVERSVERPIPFLANGLGVAVAVFTDDSKLVIVQRRDSARARPGEVDVSIVEGINSESDQVSYGLIDLGKSLSRGASEELGLALKGDDFEIVGFGVDIQFYQWSFLAVADSGCTSKDLAELHAVHAKDRWEGKLQFVEANPFDVLAFLENRKIWDLGRVTIYLALCYRFGPSRVRKAAARLARRRGKK